MGSHPVHTTPQGCRDCSGAAIGSSIDGVGSCVDGVGSRVDGVGWPELAQDGGQHSCPDQAADHRAAPGDDVSHDVPGSARLAPAVADRGHARGGHLVGCFGQRAELLSGPRHRQGHAPDREPAPGHRRDRSWCRPAFGAVLGLASTLWLGLLVNWLSAVLSLGAIALYVGFYTMLLKRRTSQNIVWGGAAGCMPVLIGWSAVTDSLAW